MKNAFLHGDLQESVLEERGRPSSFGFALLSRLFGSIYVSRDQKFCNKTHHKVVLL